MPGNVARVVRSLGAAGLVAAATLCCGAAFAQDEPWRSRGQTVVVPQTRPIAPRPGTDAVQVSVVKVDAQINDQVATTTLEITLANTTKRPLEAEMVLPVPDGAQVRAFQLDGLPNEGQARILPREEARRIYESIVRQTLDPGMVEFIGYGMIRTSVFPVPAGGTQKLRITYEELLKADGTRVDWVLPRSESIAGSGAEWSATVSIRSARPIATVYSPSHEIETKRQGDGELTVRFSPRTIGAPGSFRLSYLTAEEKGEFAATVLAYPDPTVNNGSGGYFLLLLSPSAGPESKPMDREVTIVIDRSGSMVGAKMEQAKAAALQILEGLRPGESFNIIDYSDTIRTFAKSPVAKDNETMIRAREYIHAMQAAGGTNLRDALVEALRPMPVEGQLPLVLFLTDGLPTVGVRSEVQIREDARAANTFHRRIFSFGVGFDVNAPLLAHIADSSRAVSTFVLPDEDVEVKVGQVFRQLQGPILTAPRFTFGETQTRLAGPPLRDILPGELPDIFEGGQIVILGQYLGSGPVRLTIEGEQRGRAVSHTVTFDPTAATVTNGFVPRLWAGRKIAFLIDQLRAMGAERSTSFSSGPSVTPAMQELIDEIVRLSTRFGILTEYTAFLADEGTDLARRDQVRHLAAAPAREAMEDRAGRGAVAKEMNQNTQKMAFCVAEHNTWVGSDMQQVRVLNVQACNDLALYRKNDRWVDGRTFDLLARPGADPTKFNEVVTFASPRYFEICSVLAASNRQGLLALPGEIELYLEGRRILVTR